MLTGKIIRACPADEGVRLSIDGRFMRMKKRKFASIRVNPRRVRGRL